MEMASAPWFEITDDQVRAARIGQLVRFSGSVTDYCVSFDGENFVVETNLGILTCDEYNLRTVRFF
jgi:hypothetical protein